MTARSSLMGKWVVPLFPLVAAVRIPLASFGKFTLTAADVLLAVLLLAALLRGLSTPKAVVRVLIPVIALQTLTTMVALARWGFESAFTDSLVQAKRFAEYSLIVIPASRLSRREWHRAGVLLMVLSMVLAVVAFRDILSRRPRAVSLLFYENTYGLYSAILFCISAAFLLFERPITKTETVIAISSTCASLAGLTLSASRAASLGWIAALLLMLSWRRSLARTLALAALVVAAIAVASGTISKENFFQESLPRRWSDALGNKFDTLQVRSRILAHRYAWQAVRDEGLIAGLGISGVPILTARYVEDRGDWNSEARVANTGSQYMQVFAELGVVGLMIFLFLVYRLTDLCRTSQASVRPTTGLKAALSMSLAVLVVSGTGMHTFYVPQVMAVVWTLVGFRIGEKFGYAPHNSIRCVHDRGRGSNSRWPACQRLGARKCS